MPYFFSADAQTQSGKWLIMLVLVIDVWALLITAHIVRHALETGFATGISLSIALMLVTLLAIERIAPQPSIIEKDDAEVDPVAFVSSRSQCNKSALPYACQHRLITNLT